MRERRAGLHLSGCILVLLAGCQIRPLHAAESMTGEINEMKKQIDAQSRQIEKLQASLEQQQRELQKIISTLAERTDPTLASSGISASQTPPVQEMLSGQQNLGEIELIKGELRAAADNAAQANQRMTKLETDTAAYNKANDAKVKQLGNFSFSGDIRLRYEPFFQEGIPDRHRERIRVRLNLTGKLSDEFSGGLSLATGSLDDPISTNQTLTGFLNRKNFGVDKAFIAYKPKYASFLKLEAGKFEYPWYRTPLTFDSDVNPEGFAETLSFNLKSPILKSITVVGFQLPVNEVSGGYDSFVLGGQIQSQFRLGSKARLGLYGAGININRADPIAVALDHALKPSLPNSNTLKLDANGHVTGYGVKFAYLDAIARLELDTSPRFPTTLQFNFVNNVRGSRERSGYWADLVIGRLKEAGDLQFGYSFIRIEKDAVIGAWNESDLRSSTNVRNHRLQLAYRFSGNFAAHFTAWIGRLGNPLDNISLVPAGVRAACTGADNSSCVDPQLKRLQLDLIYKF